MSSSEQATLANGSHATYTGADASGVFQSLPPGRPMSLSLWGLDFSDRLPCVLSSDGVEASVGALSRVRDFIGQAYPGLSQEGLGRPPSPTVARAKAKYLGGYSDVIELRHAGATIGVLIGAPEDWSTYYVRSFAVVPRFQRPSLLRRFIKQVLFAALIEHGVERVVAETSPANMAMTRLLVELRFHATGHGLSDRWGALVRYTKFLDADCEAAFLDSFAGTASSRARARKELET